MGEICWDFPILGTGNESGNNIAAITMFKGAGTMDGLAREVCQNSLDAKDNGLYSNTPVIVKFELHHIKKNDSSMFDGYELAIQRSREYWDNSPLKTDEIIAFLDNINESISVESIPVLVMSDYNTTGLRGVNATGSEKSYWNLLVNTEGISIKDSKSSAGSYGIGKNAPFAYSGLNLVFYNTLAVDGGRAFEGVAKLATSMREHEGRMRTTQPIGKYLYLEDIFTGRPILPDDNCPLASSTAFKRDNENFGTDVAIFGFKESEYPEWEDLIARAIIKNFILALYNNKLLVTIKSGRVEHEISKATLEHYLFKEFNEVSDLQYTRQIYRTITDCDDKKDIKIAEEGDLTLFVKYSETYIQALSRFRSTGMLIRTTTNDVLPHFSVVAVVNDVGNEDLSTTLRKSEPPQHNEWNAKYITDNPELFKKAKRYIAAIRKAVQDLLDEYDKVEISDVMDGGVGSYLPDSSGLMVNGDLNDGLTTDVKVEQIYKTDGRVLYKRSYESADGAIGTPKSGEARKTGETKRRRKKKKKIKLVNPDSTKKKGVSTGKGKVRVITPNITDHRTFYLGGNRYRLFANCPEEYKNLFIQYYAMRDDLSADTNALTVKSIKVNNSPILTVDGNKIGPILFTQGENIAHVEFEDREIMAVMPEFSVEVRNEE